MTDRAVAEATRRGSPDTIVVGDGVIGLASALALARDGRTVLLIGRPERGAASLASAGLLAPSLGSATAAVRRIFTIARDRYPAFVHWLAQRTGIEVPLNRAGILETIDQASAPGPGRPLDAREVATMEPLLAPGVRVVHHADDGCVDTVRLVEAMREAVRCEWAIDVVHARAARLECADGHCTLVTEDHHRHTAGHVVVAAGAWSALIDGLPFTVRVEPVRGQILALAGSPLTHAVAGDDAYLVPRRDVTLVGSTLERTGFEVATTRPALERLHRAAAALVPSLRDARVVDSWAGLRPMTPDAVPVLDRDPRWPRVIYATGHGKNGILLAPLTGEIVAALVAGAAPPVDVAPFAVDRFDRPVADN